MLRQALLSPTVRTLHRSEYFSPSAASGAQPMASSTVSQGMVFAPSAASTVTPSAVTPVSFVPVR